MSDTKTLFEKHGGRFLRPNSVGSSVHWYVHVDESVLRYGNRKGQRVVLMHSELKLTDCDDSINWHVGDDMDDLYKIDRAIEELTEFRNAMTRAYVARDKAKKALGIKPEDEDDDL